MVGAGWQACVDGVPAVGFVDRNAPGANPDAGYDADVADFRRRMEGLVAADTGFAVVDFSAYHMTEWDAGRAVVSLLLTAHRQLETCGGGLLVCHHPVQLNPDLQEMFRLDRIVGIYRSRAGAIAAAQTLGRS